ncbi:PTS sugar transporter subunit IIA [Mesomycoplasma ovipneumoniae]|uniref:Mannitol-specific phosphotransferase enzyme IIA component n=2 Tax=Mesomycoplasma ovipneumoniae TaxID=29562 RepID=A0AAJ2PBG3_9BACT|nr:PTS sugar transporter subunit IIA [Mesomycoplasma ovipneumoniae]MDW2906869.1 PTS sugar transporter subunit IIA [Mesomycoplasma ovipneumoniae]MDW2908070.1 PTS sugar transporter subunit IIA [Mesomycoplasma ovipneumoniae]MDW2909300.1 PTS sugar transporter subunit IIA [Mesomycoplasma ovipneumoniae]MDW2909617.1 PTS sugar transporter subunit IIA [Mesomycoplasma ovipneumoniae]MDW2911277.1 PTS sugar transporter subunit IIA [Mesomycoplasma ovipneumoniae]
MDLKIENIQLNQTIESKKEAFTKLIEIFQAKNCCKYEYLQSMEKRDLESSVALGNYLALVHGNYDSNDLIFKNCIEIIHLKNTLYWDDQPIRFIIGLAVKNDDQINYIEKIGLAFIEIEKVEEILNSQNLTKEKILNWINQA